MSDIDTPVTAQSDIIQDHPDWQDGDFTLISSDGWRFRVPSEVLFSAIEVLSDSPATGVKEFQFPDAEIESMAVIEQFLFLTTHGAIDRSMVTRGCCWDETTVQTVFTNLLHFLHKYDCESTLKAFRRAIGRGQLRGWEAFSIGVLAHDDDVAGELCYISDHLPDSIRRSAGPRYRYALERSRVPVAQRFEVMPMTPIAAKVIAALAEFDNLKEHPLFCYGGAILISSDKWLFRAPSYLLQNAGLQAIFKVGSGARGANAPQAPEFLIFDDGKTGTANMLEHLLNLVMHGKLFPPQGREWQDCGVLGDGTVNTFRYILALLKEHRCLGVIERFGEEVIKLMECGVLEPRFGFGLGLLTGDKRVCAASVTFYDPQCGRFQIHEAIAVIMRWNPPTRNDPLVLALYHVQAFVNGPGQSFERYMSWRVELVHNPTAAVAWYGFEAELELGRFWDRAESERGIVDLKQLREQKRSPFKRHLAQCALYEVRSR